MDPTKPADIELWHDIERRLSALERASRIVPSGANGGSIVALESSASDDYGNLLTPGPSCVVEVPPSGRVFILASALASIYLPPGSGVNLGIAYLSVALTGANVFTPVRTTPGHDSETRIQRDNTTPEASLNTVIVHGRMMDGLNPGLTTFTCKYARISDEPLAASIGFSNRFLVVLPL
jgi:hypothetical protein